MGAKLSRAGMLPILALQVLSEYGRSDSRPPVTAALLLANVLIYLRWPPLLDRTLPSLDDVWFNPYLIVKNRDVKRFFLSALYHVGEPHLVYNMMSLLWKGVQLESSVGSVEFTSMVAALLAMSQGITLLLAKSLFLLLNYERAYFYEYSVGFSGVLFAMKVVLNSQNSDDFTYVQYGMVVPTRHAAWAELLLIQLFVPGVSFLGHLSGILAGILYLRLRGSFPGGSDPLASLIRALGWPLRFLWGILSRIRRPPPRISGRGTAGGGGRQQPRRARGMAGVWRCPACTYDNSGWTNVCEMCSTERDRYGFSSRRRSSNQPPAAADLPLEELRRRRLERFDR